MIEPDQDARHLDRAGLQQYLASGAHSVLKLEGVPNLYLIIDATTQTLRLRVPQPHNTLPDVTGYTHIAAELVHWRGAQWCQLSIGGPIILDAYSVLLAIADRMQKSSAEFSFATRAALDAFREILASGRGLSEEVEIGLFGEVLTLQHLLTTLAPHVAIDAWRGSASEEHDFSLSSLDLEVKTTTNEARVHWISSLTQLRPSLARPLFLASIQVTGAGSDGQTLADIIAQTEEMMPEQLRGVFRAKLLDAKWRESALSTYARRFRLRTRPEIYEVGGEFPAITPETLVAANVSSAIIQLRYMIDLSHVAAASQVPAPLVAFGG